MTAWLDTFYIGTSITYPTEDFTPLADLLDYQDVPVNPEEAFAPFSAYLDLVDGGRAGIGFPKTSWSWQHREDAHIEIFQEFCPGLSALVYIRTPTNLVSSGERLWRTYLCQMLMPPVEIDFQGNQALGFTIEFRHMIIQTERT